MVLSPTGIKRLRGLYGYSAAEAVGLNIAILVPPDRADEFTEIRSTLAAGGRIHQLETVRRRSDSSLVDVSLSIAPIIDQDGVVIGSAGITRDITRRKRMEEALRQSEERFRLVRKATRGRIIRDGMSDSSTVDVGGAKIIGNIFGYPPPEAWNPMSLGGKTCCTLKTEIGCGTSFQTALSRRSDFL